MRDLIFKFGTEHIAIKVNFKQLQFCKLEGGLFKYAPIDGLKLSTSGIIKEFPDLKNKSDKTIRRIAIQRFKDHIQKLKTEQEVEDYLKEDLKKHGYELKFRKRPGFRKQKVK